MLQVVNKILGTFVPTAELYYNPQIKSHKTKRLWLKTRYGSMAVRVSPHSGSLTGKYGQLGFGGTAALAIGQLIRWYRDQSRVPLSAWEYWASDKMRLCTSETVKLLGESTYPDPKKTCCVLCGSDRPGDWWSLDGVFGPCCAYGHCLRNI